MCTIAHLNHPYRQTIATHDWTKGGFKYVRKKWASIAIRHRAQGQTARERKYSQLTEQICSQRIATRIGGKRNRTPNDWGSRRQEGSVC